MKRIFLVLLLSASLLSRSQTRYHILPEPVSLTAAEGELVLEPGFAVSMPSGGKMPWLRQAFDKKLQKATGKSLRFTDKDAQVKLRLNSSRDQKLGNEGYNLQVTKSGITLSANTENGLFYGLQTLYQLMPAAIESDSARAGSISVPCVSITDYPRFQWRGLMFDVARHFFTKEEVKRFIDDMVKYKYNLLHLHLSDDEGWRIEIKGLPKLTEVGAWSVKKVGYFGTFTPPTADEPRNYGGFFTQDNIRELVAYASERFVNVMPEIDVPGHSLAAVASYPELSCTPDAVNYKVRSGEQIMDWSHGAPPIALIDNTLCPANEKVYTFLDTVIGQLAQLFPFEYIHLGGDECPKNFWEKTPAIIDLMKREKLKNMEEVQSYFEKRVEKIVLSKGKKFMGWDEILEGGLAPSAAVMSWRGMKGGEEAAKMGHEVVMSPTTFAYLDYMQADPAIEPRVYASLRLSKAYQFEPLPSGVDPRYIKGGQGNIWTEQMYNFRTVQYMIWPRAMAVAESVWSPAGKKNWDRFFESVESHFSRLDAAQTKYSRAAYDPIIEVSRSEAGVPVVKLSTEVKGLDIYYSWDNSFPDRYYPKYTEPIMPPKDAFQLKMITYRNGLPVGRMMDIAVEELTKRMPKK